MAQYIDKDILVAKIESMKKYAQTLGDNAINSSMQQFFDGMKESYVDLLSFLDTLEAKEVDLDKILTEFMSKYAYENGGEYPSAIDIAKYFFKLGLNKA